MDAQMRKIEIISATHDDDGVKKDEFAKILFTVPMNTLKQRKEVMALFEVLRSEFVALEVIPFQQIIPADDESERIANE